MDKLPDCPSSGDDPNELSSSKRSPSWSRLRSEFSTLRLAQGEDLSPVRFWEPRSNASFMTKTIAIHGGLDMKPLEQDNSQYLGMDQMCIDQKNDTPFTLRGRPGSWKSALAQRMQRGHKYAPRFYIWLKIKDTMGKVKMGNVFVIHEASLVGALGGASWITILEGIHSQKMADDHHSHRDFSGGGSLGLGNRLLTSFEALIAAIVLTSSSLTAYHYLRRHEKYMDLLIMVNIGIGTGVGRFMGLEGTEILLQVIPWCVIVAMLLSRLLTATVGSKQTRMLDLEFSEKHGIQDKERGTHG
ncbi:hypothetical protein QBC38DRAFT_442695 [Podospora fimiseda]|uniref:Uncharacterized protein n=1 Tax=Podospora fimiseda TaxID=252190 RepID=A0AAN7BS29_9PEZI|nr:hypothetical protein QBC38DRAFT_442695 [Podospora fimiseda]